MNDKYLRKDITAVVVDEHGYPKTTTYDEEALELENRLEVIATETVKVKKELEFALNHQYNWQVILNVIGSLAFFLLAAFFAVYFISKDIVTYSMHYFVSIFMCTAIGGLFLYYSRIDKPHYTKKQIEELTAKLEVAEEMKEERQRELEEYLKNMKALEPVLEETVVDLSGEYQIDIENVREELEREAISRTRKREKRGR